MRVEEENGSGWRMKGEKVVGSEEGQNGKFVCGGRDRCKLQREWEEEGEECDGQKGKAVSE